jgi:hypothetical protein
LCEYVDEDLDCGFLDQFSNYQVSETPCTEDLEQDFYLQTIKGVLSRKLTTRLHVVLSPVGDTHWPASRLV